MKDFFVFIYIYVNTVTFSCAIPFETLFKDNKQKTLRAYFQCGPLVIGLDKLLSEKIAACRPN